MFVKIGRARHDVFEGGAENLWMSDLCGVWTESTDCGRLYYTANTLPCA